MGGLCWESRLSGQSQPGMDGRVHCRVAECAGPFLLWMGDKTWRLGLMAELAMGIPGPAEFT